MKVDCLDRSEWVELLNQPTTVSTPFQTPAWLDHQLRTIPGTENRSLAFRFESGTLVALPLISIKGFGGRVMHWGLGEDEYGGPIASRALRNDELNAIYSYLSDKLRPVRLTVPPTAGLPAGWSPAAPWRMDANSTHLIHLPTCYDTWFDAMADSKCRRNIRRGEKCNLTVSHAGSVADVSAYWHLCERQAVRRRNPVRSPSRQFIESVLATEITRLHVVYSEGRPAAGLITLESRDQTVYYLGASDPEFSEHRPADFGLSEVVREAIRDGRRTLNLGASGSSQSLRRFKEKFGAIEHQYFSYFAPDLWLQIGKTLRYYRWRVKQSWTGQSTVSP